MSLDHQLAGDLAEAVALLERAGLIDYNGHVSARADGGLIAINSGASNRAAVTPDDITLMDAGGAPGEGLPTPPKERFLHMAIYARRPDVSAIVHCHSTWCTMLSTCSVAYEPVFPQGSLVGEARLFEKVASINTPDLGDSLCRGPRRSSGGTPAIPRNADLRPHDPGGRGAGALYGRKRPAADAGAVLRAAIPGDDGRGDRRDGAQSSRPEVVRQGLRLLRRQVIRRATAESRAGPPQRAACTARPSCRSAAGPPRPR
jgi:hypothetical protein